MVVSDREGWWGKPLNEVPTAGKTGPAQSIVAVGTVFQRMLHDLSRWFLSPPAIVLSSTFPAWLSRALRRLGFGNGRRRALLLCEFHPAVLRCSKVRLERLDLCHRLRYLRCERLVLRPQQGNFFLKRHTFSITEVALI